jgi:Zn-dependent protease with chaperone function
MRRLFVILGQCLTILLFTLPSAKAQPSTYRPLQDDSLLLDQLLTSTTQRLAADESAITGNYKKYITEQYKERFNSIKEKYTRREFISDAPVNDYLRKLLNIIVAANPSLQPLQPNLLFSKVYWPNAVSYGEGTLAFNISLFNRLQNESQAAFIICHELSHYYLDHSNKAIRQYVSTLYSDDFQKELRDIQKSEYQQGQRLKTIAKGLSYKSRRHSRDHESEADSMALVLLKNTGFDVRESLSCLALLDSVDKDKYEGSMQLKQHFDFTAYPFQSRWLRQRSLSLGEAMGNYNKENKTGAGEDDSLKTHPDCSARIQKLQQAVAAAYRPQQQRFLVNEVLFDSLTCRFDYEIIEYCYRADAISRALYYALQLHHQRPDEIYLVCMIGKCLNSIYDAQKTHKLSEIVDLPSAGDPSEYKTLLQFIQSLSLDDIAAISYYFMEKHQPLYKDDPAVTAVLQHSKKRLAAQTK